MKRFRFAKTDRKTLADIFHRRTRENRGNCREFLGSLEGIVTIWRYKYEGVEPGDRTELSKRTRRIRRMVEKLIAELDNARGDPRYGGEIEVRLDDEDWRPILEQLRDNFRSAVWKKPIDHAARELDIEALLVVEYFGIEIKNSERGDAVRVLQLCYDGVGGPPITSETARKHVERFRGFTRGERGPGSITRPT